MNVVIVGGGKSGLFLAEKLRTNHHVIMIESRPERADYISAHIPGIKVVRGDGCEPSVLDASGVSDADLVAALTGDDEDNLVVSFLSKQTYKVPLVFARTNHPKNEWMFTKTWGVDVAVSTASVIYSLIEKQASLGEVLTMMKLQAENMMIDELVLCDGSPAENRKISELDLPPTAHVMAILSKGEVVVPHGETVLSAGDEVLILSASGDEELIRRIFGLTCDVPWATSEGEAHRA